METAQVRFFFIKSNYSQGTKDIKWKQVRNYIMKLEAALQNIDIQIPNKIFESKGVFNNMCSETIQIIYFLRIKYNNENKLIDELDRVIKAHSLKPSTVDYPPEIIDSSLRNRQERIQENTEPFKTIPTDNGKIERVEGEKEEKRALFIKKIDDNETQELKKENADLKSENQRLLKQLTAQKEKTDLLNKVVKKLVREWDEQKKEIKKNREQIEDINKEVLGQLEL